MVARHASSSLFRGALSMSLFDRRSFLILAVSSLAACGFEPVYGERGVASDLRGSVLVTAPADRRSFAFVEHLEERLGRANAPTYQLDYVLTVRQEGLAISGSNDITRYNLLGNAAFALKNLAERVWEQEST